MANSDVVVPSTPTQDVDAAWREKIEAARAETTPVVADPTSPLVEQPEPVQPPPVVETQPPVTEVSKEAAGIPDMPATLTEPQVQELLELMDAPPRAQNPDTINDLSEFVNIVLGDINSLIASVDETYSKMPESELLKELRDPNSKISQYKLMQATTTQMQTSQYRYAIKMLADRLEKLKAGGATDDKLFRGSKTITGEIKGTSAKLNVLARLGGLKRVYLLNSGFWVTIRPFTIAELHSFYQTVDLEKMDMGRHLGGVFYSFLDLNLKERFMEFFASAVVMSNLDGWEKENVIADNISIQDYDICMWAVCTLIYKDGIELTMFCAKPDCGYRNPKFQIDLNKLRLNDNSILDRAKMEEFMQKKVVTLQEIEAYRKQPQFTREVIYDDPKTGSKFKYTLQVPTVGEHIRTGKMLLTQIVKFIGKETSLRNEQSRVQVTINLYRMFIAWISRFDDVTNPEASWWTGEQDAIMETLESSYHENTTFYKDLTKFISDTKISHIAYVGIKCPQCGAVVEQNAQLDDLVAVDVSALFFALACRQIEAMGKQNSR